MNNNIEAESGFIRGIAHYNNSTIDLKVNLDLDLDSRRVSKSYSFNGTIVSSLDFIGKLNVVLFEAKDLSIITGSPISRRKFLDIHISQQDFSYLKALQRYNKVLQSRNKVLKDIKKGKSSKIELEFWTEKIIEDGLIISRQRKLKLNQIKKETLKIFPLFISGKEDLDINFVPSYKNLDSLNNESLKVIFSENIRKEIATGSTIYGPHKDDFDISINNQPSSEFSSRGQIRTITLALKLGEANSLKNSVNNSPIIALDDILSELDEARRVTVMDYITKFDQVLLTVPDEKLLIKNSKLKGKIFYVNNGEIIE